MKFKELSLFNFKNFETLEIDFSGGLNFFVGHNGAGKTNILDALYYLSMTKSATNSIDSSNIKFDENLFLVKSNIELKNKSYAVSCAVQVGKKKDIRVNKKEHEKLSEHIGLFPSVMISPNDTDLIYDSNEVRRKFFDSAISQSNSTYLQHLITYSFALKSRNALLKQYGLTGKMDYELLQVYTNQLVKHGQPIFKERKQYLVKFLELFILHYSSLQSQNEHVSIDYESHWENGIIDDLFKKSLQKDLALQRTSIGVHKDAFVFNLFEKGLKKHGSQGQQKSFLVALKLAQFDLLALQKKVKPVLLLDDVFDKLDDERMNKLLKKVTDKNYGQLFITDARPERTIKLLKQNKLTARIFEVEKGTITNTTDYEAKI